MGCTVRGKPSEWTGRRGPGQTTKRDGTSHAGNSSEQCSETTKSARRRCQRTCESPTRRRRDWQAGESRQNAASVNRTTTLDETMTRATREQTAGAVWTEVWTISNSEETSSKVRGSGGQRKRGRLAQGNAYHGQQLWQARQTRR